MPAPDSPINGPQRFIGAVFGFIFFAIGVTVIGFLWTAQGFDAPPLFFKLVGSLISLGFITMGGTVCVSALKGQPLSSGKAAADEQAPGAPAAGYVCPACGARLGEDADVSPRGDVKCGYCRKWFNIHDA
jgi:hypothetical protein